VREQAEAETVVVPAEPAAPQPELIVLGRGRLRQILAYAHKVYGLDRLLGEVYDSRRKPATTAPAVAAILLHAGLLRIRSFNALEPRLCERSFARLLGRSEDDARLCSVDTLSRAARVMDLDSLRALAQALIHKAERNKVFREGWHGALRFAAIDGWEPFCSRSRHCAHCLVRHLRLKDREGNITPVEQYYHRYVVALLIDQRFDLVLDFEPLLPKDLRPLSPKRTQAGTTQLVKADLDEGELTAATRLVKRLKHSFGWVDVVVADALYANGPFLTTLHQLGLGAVITARKPTDEPLREALHVWAGQPAHKLVRDPQAHERIALWDCRDLETLRTYDGKIRCVRAEFSRPEQPDRKPTTWCMLVIGHALKLPPEKILAVARARWHIENTGFHQWVTRWRFAHVFCHHPTAIRALFWLFFTAFNLLTLFLYLQVRSYGRDRGRCVTRTISRLVDEMLDDLARLDQALWDTS
jgi:hypothetical protein